MSGGYFDSISCIQNTIEDLELLIKNNNSEEIDEWGDTVGHFFSEKTITEFKNAIYYLERAYIYAHRIDYLMCGDDIEESFHSRLQENLNEQLKEYNHD